ncbi:MAG TPA: hypothetical protein VIJ28_13295 [Chloroflexota bacterium]|jgi:hypothetical protein
MGLCVHPTFAYAFVVMRQDELRVLKRECHAASPHRHNDHPWRIAGLLLMVIGRWLLAWGERVR